MHTKKRHQNMFQDLNRKLHHAEKDRESPASDSKVTHCSISLLIIHFHRFSRKHEKRNSKKKKTNITEATLTLKDTLVQNDPVKQPVVCVLNYGCQYLEVI